MSQETGNTYRSALNNHRDEKGQDHFSFDTVFLDMLSDINHMCRVNNNSAFFQKIAAFELTKEKFKADVEADVEAYVNGA
ncbi:MAG: hypothetical protein ACI9TY_001129 [Alphaproteobacteria bacterium]